jgi:hypothetical protein
MNSTKHRAAAIFFAELLLPLRLANLRRGVAYLDRGPRRESYWGEVLSRAGGLERHSHSACDAATLLASLGSYWARRNEPDLLQLLPHLEALRKELTGAARVDDQARQELTEFNYPLF